MLEIFRKVLFRFGSRSRHVATLEDRKSHRRSANSVERVKATCNLGRMHARSMYDRSLAPELTANERKCYQLYKHDAIALARRVADPALRDHAIGHLVELCMDGGEEEEAKSLFDIIQSDFVKRDISEKHPLLSAELLTRSFRAKAQR
jgi:hypothetical protein